MDLSKLDQNDRTAAIASAVLVIAGLFAATTYVTYGITWLAILAGVGMLFVVLQPQIASGVNLPGSKGSLMLILGGIAGVIMVLALLTTLGFIFIRLRHRRHPVPGRHRRRRGHGVDRLAGVPGGGRQVPARDLRRRGVHDVGTVRAVAGSGRARGTARGAARAGTGHAGTSSGGSGCSPRPTATPTPEA